jgi:hypothetical protein
VTRHVLRQFWSNIQFLVCKTDQAGQQASPGSSILALDLWLCLATKLASAPGDEASIQYGGDIG